MQKIKSQSNALTLKFKKIRKMKLIESELLI